jgi:hypothetical protein
MTIIVNNITAKRQLKRFLKALIKEFWEICEHIYNKHTDEVRKKDAVKELRSKPKQSQRLNNIKRNYKQISKLNSKSTSDVSSIHQIEEQNMEI